MDLTLDYGNSHGLVVQNSFLYRIYINSLMYVRNGHTVDTNLPVPTIFYHSIKINILILFLKVA